MKNQNLNNAKKAKNDEFYTQLVDIEKEMQHYTEHFKNKIVYCNCDDARISNFYKYFSDNFEKLGLKKLICTGYNKNGKGYLMIYTGTENIDDIQYLNGNGNFRSEECIEFLKESDVVVTNPPFSLFREYVAQLMEYNKKFIIIGNGNAVTYKEIFPLIKDNKLWIGVSKGIGGKFSFIVPNDYDNKFVYEENGVRLGQVNSACWFTNIEHKKNNEELILHKKYSNDEYPKYDDIDAIEVSKVCNIPMDYDGVMGVPITFLDKYCPTQFEIIDISPHFYTLVEQGLPKPKQLSLASYDKKDPYVRILIKKVQK